MIFGCSTSVFLAYCFPAVHVELQKLNQFEDFHLYLKRNFKAIKHRLTVKLLYNMNTGSNLENRSIAYSVYLRSK